MAEIQVDMFEVKLGAAVLLQFRSNAGVVRVLADGGVTGYAKDHVLKKLPNVFVSFDRAGETRIDLLMGTHYDADHLDGLVPIIRDKTIAIGEAWLPPVANDTQDHAGDTEPADSDLLALQFAGEDGDAIFQNYIERKAIDCQRLADAERTADEARRIERDPEVSIRLMDGVVRNGRTEVRDFFQAHLDDANRTLGHSGSEEDHGSDPVALPPDFNPVRNSMFHGNPFNLDDGWGWRRRMGRSARAHSLAHLRKSAAKHAINAASLFDVVKALKARTPPVPIRCALIDTATPRRFIWDKNDSRFRPSAKGSSDGPELILLAPSKALVKKHWDRLPLTTYAELALLRWIPPKKTTPSNELSYVAKFTFAGQNILITGDTGFVDFRPERSRKFYPGLLQQLANLHVVQVAHHAGANDFFYNALLASPFATQETKSYLLLSHAPNDRLRPSPEFGSFMAELDGGVVAVELLFTSQPLETRVRDFKPAFSPVVPGPSTDRGDVRLTFANKAWKVDSHSIAAP